MKKTWIIVIAVVAVLVIYCVSSYNSLVTQEETVGTAWSNVENQYQRRSDLIPNLVNTGICCTRKRNIRCCGICQSKSYSDDHRHRRPDS